MIPRYGTLCTIAEFAQRFVKTVVYTGEQKIRKTTKSKSGRGGGGARGKREREANESWTDRWRSAKLSPSARHDPFQRHVGSNQRAKKSRTMEEGGRERLHPKICGPTGDTRTLLVTSRWMLRAYTGPPCRQRVCISYDTKTSHYFPLSLWIGAHSASPASFLLFSSARRPRACDHHYARPPSLVPISPPRVLLPSSSAASFLPSSCSLPIPPLGYLRPQITYPLNESRRKRCSPLTD